MKNSCLISKQNAAISPTKSLMRQLTLNELSNVSGLILLCSSWKGLPKSFFFLKLSDLLYCMFTDIEKLDCFLDCQSSGARVSICIFLWLERPVSFSFIASTNLWQLLQSVFSVNWGSESATDKTFLKQHWTNYWHRWKNRIQILSSYKWLFTLYKPFSVF